MNELVIPPAPLWYRSSVMACSPDNTLVYGSKSDIVIIREKESDAPAEVTIIQGAHSKSITSVSINKKWNDPNKYAVSLAEDSLIKIWDLNNFEKRFENKDHTEHKEPVIGAVFAGDDRIVSAASNGFVVIWNINTNESKSLKDLFNFKVSLTCLSSCPHAGWLLAFGLNNGCVIVADLRRNGKVLYKLRGHYQAVVSLSWCPAPVNVFPRHTQNKVKNKLLQTEENKNIEQNPDEETELKIEKQNPWINLVHADDGEVSSEKQNSPPEPGGDFSKECDDLKRKILGLDTSVTINDSPKKNDAEVIIEEREEIDEPIEREIKLNNDRPLPKLFDPSGDFLDDSFLEQTGPTEEEILEDKDVGNEKNSEKIVTEDEQKINVILEDSGIAADDVTPSKTEEVVEEEPRTEYLLASSGKDRSVYIWRAGTDGRMQTFFNAPKKSKGRDTKNLGSWITICWIAPDTILTSSVTGEVLAWPVPKPKQSCNQYKVVHFEHSSLIFNLVSPPKYCTPYNWRDNVDLTAWSWSQDGRLINYDLSAEKIRLCYTTVTATIACFNSSSLDPNRLAIGFRDGSIRVWDLSLPHKKIITMHKYQQKFTHKVSSLAWHPIKETILGFGTDEGRVGFIDMVSKKSTLFPHYFRNQVYKVEWGPIQGDTNNLGLYAVAEGKVVIYDLQETGADPIQLVVPEKLYIYKFAWKPDFGILLLNGKDGSLVVLTTALCAITTVYLNEKGLNGIVWHPDAFTHKTEVSPRCNWFAATTTKGLLIYDCTPLKKSPVVCENVMEQIIATFEGHLKPPLALAWCPFDGNKIVSTAADGLAHVWDVISKTVISTFVDPLLSHNPAVVWSPIDPDLIILGDKVIRLWSISKNPPKIDEEFMAIQKQLLSNKSESEKLDKNKIKVEIPRINISPKNCIVPSLYVSNDDNLALQVNNMRKLMNDKENKTDIENDSDVIEPLHLFGVKEQVSQLLNANYIQQKKQNKYKSCELISLWKGNVAELIQEAINENRVTQTIITLAPMVSPKLWQDACEVYAKKLSENADSDPLEVAMYYLICHKVEEAINCLCLNLMFKEALALAKHRLPDNSEIITQVTEKWAEHCIINGNFETAAFCYISIGQYINAAKVLARRNNIEFLRFAAELAGKAANKELFDSIKFKCNEIETSKNDLVKAESDLGEKEIIEEKLPSRIDAMLYVKDKEAESTDAELPETAEDKELTDSDNFERKEVKVQNSDLIETESDLDQKENLREKCDSVIESVLHFKNTDEQVVAEADEARSVQPILLDTLYDSVKLTDYVEILKNIPLKTEHKNVLENFDSLIGTLLNIDSRAEKQKLKSDEAELVEKKIDTALYDSVKFKDNEVELKKNDGKKLEIDLNQKKNIASGSDDNPECESDNIDENSQDKTVDESFSVNTVQSVDENNQMIKMTDTEEKVGKENMEKSLD